DAVVTNCWATRQPCNVKSGTTMDRTTLSLSRERRIGPLRLRHMWLRLIVRLVPAVVVLYWAAVHSLPPREFEVDPAHMATEVGSAVIADVRDELRTLLPLTTVVSDGLGAPTASKLQLFEDGRLLGPAHALHEDIRQKGGGRYSHWGASLYFSSSD